MIDIQFQRWSFPPAWRRARGGPLLVGSTGHPTGQSSSSLSQSWKQTGSHWFIPWFYDYKDIKHPSYCAGPSISALWKVKPSGPSGPSAPGGVALPEAPWWHQSSCPSWPPLTAMWLRPRCLGGKLHITLLSAASYVQMFDFTDLMRWILTTLSPSLLMWLVAVVQRLRGTSNQEHSHLLFSTASDPEWKQEAP